MKFLINANIGYEVGQRLSDAGHPSFMVSQVLPFGTTDEVVLNYSVENAMVLITRDKADFGKMVFHQNKPFHGIVVLRTHTVPTDAEAFRVVMNALEMGTIGPGKFVSF